jgi:type I restriction enzyme M protein
MARAKIESTPQLVEQVFWAFADKLRKNMDAAEYNSLILHPFF